MTSRETQAEKARILIVDDEEGIREMFKEILEECGYDCRTAPNGEAALEVLASSAFDLLLLDVLMPRMDGITCFGQIRERYPEVAVVFVTAMDDVTVAVRNVREGAYDYLVKPMTAERLEQVVGDVLARRNILLEEKQQKIHAEEEQTQQLDQGGRELWALNQLFRQRLSRYFEVVEAYQGVLDGLGKLEQDINTKYGLAPSQLPSVPAQAPGFKSSLEGLNDGQLEVLKLMAWGYSNAAIAKRLALTERSAAEQVNAVYGRLQLNRDDLEQSRVKAVLIYLQRLLSEEWESPGQL